MNRLSKHLRLLHLTLLIVLPLSTLSGCGKKLTGPFPTPPPYEKLAAAHRYTPLKKASVSEVVVPDTTLFVQHITFLNAKKQTVTAIFLRPKAESVYPVALVLHGLESDKEESVAVFGRSLAAKGIASLSLDAPLHGERAPRNGTGLIDKKGVIEAQKFAGVIELGITEQRQALDYLSGRGDVDAHRIGLIGNSMGAMMGTVTAAVDNRIVAVALCAGGDPIRPVLYDIPSHYWGRVEAISPSNYIPYIHPRPLYLINGTDDRTIGDRAVKLLVDAAGPKATVVSVTGAGHMLPPEDREKAIDWLAKQLVVSQGQ